MKTIVRIGTFGEGVVVLETGSREFDGDGGSESK